MTTRPYELLIRFNSDATVKGISYRNITTVDGKDYESDPMPLVDDSDPNYAAFADAFTATVVAERDELAALAASATALQDEVDSLTEQLAAYTDPAFNPRHIPPFSFLNRFTTDEQVAFLTSDDPLLRVGLAKLQTIITYVDLDHAETQQLIGYLVTLGTLTQQRANIILSDTVSGEL